MIYLNKNLITPDNTEYKYIKDSLVKVAYPFYIKKYLEYMGASFETKMACSGSFFNSYSILIEILSENRYFNEIAVLLNYFKDRKVFVELNIALLNASVSIINYGSPKLSRTVLRNALFLLNDNNGDIRKAAADLIGKSKALNYTKYIYNKAIGENYPDVLDNYIKNIIILTNNDKIYFKFFVNNLLSDNIRTKEISLRIIEKFKISHNKHLNKKDIEDLYSIFKTLANSKSESEKVKALLASVIGNFTNINRAEYKYLRYEFIKILFRLIKDNNSEEILYNSLESLMKLRFKDSDIFFETMQSKNRSIMFRFKVIELIGKLQAISGHAHDNEFTNNKNTYSENTNNKEINNKVADNQVRNEKSASKAADNQDADNKVPNNKYTNNIGKFHSNFDKLLDILHNSDEILIKISILRALHSIDEARAKSVIEKYLTDTNEDLRSIAEELLRKEN